nr:reverse transcriptase domain-containing protein [Tanacetum cinerariifolium]
MGTGGRVGRGGGRGRGPRKGNDERVDELNGQGNDQEFCPGHEMQKLETKFWNHVMVGAGHATYTDRFYELANPCDGGNNRAKDYTKGYADFWCTDR